MVTNHNGRDSVAPHTHRPQTILPSGRLTRWRGVDFITAAMLGVAFGVVFWGWDTFLYPGVQVLAAGFPPAGSLALGVWLIPAVVGGLVVRRPGAALFTELIAASVEMLLGNQWGVAVLISGALQGAGVEIVLALLLWRRFSIVVAVLGGISAAVLEIVAYEWWVYVPSYSWTWRIVYLICGVISGAVIAGVGGWALVRALARAGALNAFPPGQEVRETRASR
jgi:energy-coupling factor transport system substrate-specific component